ncbi:hypothetical protein G4B88_004080, partial [Cannabis sativa]
MEKIYKKNPSHYTSLQAFLVLLSLFIGISLTIVLNSPNGLSIFLLIVELKLFRYGHPINWVRTHRYHHQFVDSERDPHSPIEGFWYSHIGWLFDSNTAYQKSGSPKIVLDLENQRFYKFLQNTYILHPIALGVVLYALGGFPFVVWGMGVRVVCNYHVTWLVNSACHVWGNQAWNTGDLSRNNWWVALLAFGEGWHNNHHAFEYSARHGLEWWQIDTTWQLSTEESVDELFFSLSLTTLWQQRETAREVLRWRIAKTGLPVWMLGLGADRLRADMSRLLALLFHQGVLDEQFLQLQQLQDESSPNFVSEVVNIYFHESEKLLRNLRNLLMDKEFWDYKKMGIHLNQFMGSSSSIGAKRVRSVCVAFRAASEQNNRAGCLRALELLEHEYCYLKNKLHELFQLEQQRAMAAGV